MGNSIAVQSSVTGCLVTVTSLLALSVLQKLGIVKEDTVFYLGGVLFLLVFLLLIFAFGVAYCRPNPINKKMYEDEESIIIAAHRIEQISARNETADV